MNVSLRKKLASNMQMCISLLYSMNGMEPFSVPGWQTLCEADHISHLEENFSMISQTDQQWGVIWTGSIQSLFENPKAVVKQDNEIEWSIVKNWENVELKTRNRRDLNYSQAVDLVSTISNHLSFSIHMVNICLFYVSSKSFVYYLRNIYT